jgi:photosystem II stability/assembly factor-like uncharacterized protein
LLSRTDARSTKPASIEEDPHQKLTKVPDKVSNMNRLRFVWRGLLRCLLFSAILSNPLQKFSFGLPVNPAADISGTSSPTTPAPTPSPTIITPTLQSLFFPIVVENTGLSDIELNQVWFADSKGNRQDAFLSHHEIRFYGLGYSRGVTDSIHLAWDQAGPCGANQVFSGTVQVNPGVWQTYLSSTAPDCIGVYTNTLQFTYRYFTETLSADFVVNPPSQVIIGAHQGFDRCNIPSIADMQTWWFKSPYYSINLYIGGSLSHCDNQELNAEWVQKVSKQGWTFIPTWVGPQAPCTSFRERISYDPQISNQQGRTEADSAIEALTQIGLLGENIVYYDVESYSAAKTNPSCRDAMNSFLNGWTERLHARGYRAGAYGASCNSFISEWATISPTLDDVWIAHWHLPPLYDPEATVWDAPCLSNLLWANHQRIKQYAGDHIETWGGVSMPIDSDVIDGEVSYLPVTSTRTISSSILAKPETLYTMRGKQIQDMQALKNGLGWFLSGDHLIWRDASRSIWGQSVLPSKSEETILAVTFQNEALGWVATQDIHSGKITIYTTHDSKDHWEKASVILTVDLVSQAWFSFIDSKTGWLALRLQSSSNFNLGQLFHTDDGGVTWTELPVPVGGKIFFTNRSHGWLEGGVSGAELYSTENGGNSWTKAGDSVYGNLTGEAGSEAILGNAHQPNFDNLPGALVDVQFSDAMTGWARVELSSCSGDKIPVQLQKSDLTNPFQCTRQELIFETGDGGRTWTRLPL